ncbi:MAG TPA: pyridoxamine 5'-phosphate oxidase family protein [Pseudonocardia sp.]|jgi:hypothetical protein
MNETSQELDWLQALLDRSIGAAGSHLTSIVEPGRRTLLASRICADLRGTVVLNVATVTASGQPRLSAVDGHFLHGRWHFSTAGNASKAGHLRARPALSVAYTPRDGYGIWAHGTATEIDAASEPGRRLLAYLSEYYGQSPTEWADSIAMFRVDPRWMVGFAMSDAEWAEFEQTLPARSDRLPAALAALERVS